MQGKQAGWLALTLAAALQQGCTSPEKARPETETGAKVRQVWNRRLDGLMTDLAMATVSGGALVATVPDPERSAPDSPRWVAYLTAEGDLRWRARQEKAVRAIAVARDGTVAVVAHHDDGLVAYDGTGRELWRTQGGGTPLVLDSGKVLCHFDAAVRPGRVFDLLEASSGKRLVSYPSAIDVLALSVASDQGAFGLGLAQGNVVLVGRDFLARWQRWVEGEVIDVAVSPVDEGRLLAVLHRSRTKGLRVTVFDEKGLVRSIGAPALPATQIELAAGDRECGPVVLFGNGPSGQWIQRLGCDGAGRGGARKLVEKWRRGLDRAADYSTRLGFSGELLIAGFETVLPSGKETFLRAYDLNGLQRWEIPLATEEGAYLFAHSYSPGLSIVVVGTDDSRLAGYRVGL